MANFSIYRSLRCIIGLMIKPIHQLFPKIEAVSKKRRNKVAIGVLRDSPEVRKALEKGSEYADLIVVGKKKIPGFETVALGETTENEYSKAVIKLLQEGKVDAIVRGQVKYGEFEKMFKEKYGYGMEGGHCGLMQDFLGRQWFCTSTDPFDKSEVPEYKIDLIEKSVHYMGLYGIRTKVGVLAGDFTFDRGDDRWIDQTIHNAEYVVKVLADEGYDIKNYAHLIDEAVAECNLIVFINGSQGNFIYRTIYQFGGGLEMAWAVFVPVPYIETSRYHAEYDTHIIFANAEATLLKDGVIKVYDPKQDRKKKWSNKRVIM